MGVYFGILEARLGGKLSLRLTLFWMGYGTVAIPSNFLSNITLRQYIPPIPSYPTFGHMSTLYS